MPTSVLIKPASSLCNMRCDYCFYLDETKNRSVASHGLMSEETLENIVKKAFAFERSSITFAFQGGEPTLRGLDFFHRFIALEKQYNTRHISVTHALQTNGLLLTEEWCRFFRDNSFLIGLSIDGIKASHDHYRHTQDGQPTFYSIKNAADLMTRCGVDFNILTVVTRETLPRLSKIYRSYEKEGWKYQQYIPCIEPFDAGQGMTDSFLTAEEYGKFLITLFDLWYDDWKRGEPTFIRQFENYLAVLLGYEPESCDQRGICNLQNIIEADGSVYPCDFFALDEWLLGNINENSFEDFPKSENFHTFLDQSRLLSASCSSCSFSGICRGGCRRHRTPDASASLSENYFCESYKMFFTACLDRLQIIASSLR